jgi:hypothetical protein
VHQQVAAIPEDLGLDEAQALNCGHSAHGSEAEPGQVRLLVSGHATDVRSQ